MFERQGLRFRERKGRGGKLLCSEPPSRPLLKSACPFQVAACIAEDFECRVDKMEPATWKQMTKAWRKLYSNPAYAGPDCYFEVENMSALVDEKKGVTLIYFNLRWRAVGSPMKDWVVEHTWKRRTDDKWMLVTTHSFQGSNIKQGFGF